MVGCVLEVEGECPVKEWALDAAKYLDGGTKKYSYREIDG